MAELLDISVLNEISSFWPDSEEIKKHIEGIENNITANKAACLDSAKCLLETICNTVIHEHNHIVLDKDGNELPVYKLKLSRRYAEALQALHFTRGTAPDIEVNLFNALVKSIEEVGRFRNHYSQFGHGRIANCEKLADDICQMALSTLISGCLVLFKEHSSQSDVQVDVRNSLRPYEAFAETNDIVDANCLIQVDEEQCEVILNGGLVFRPSQILFALEREAYADIVSTAEDSDAA